MRLTQQEIQEIRAAIAQDAEAVRRADWAAPTRSSAPFLVEPLCHGSTPLCTEKRPAGSYVRFTSASRG